MKEQPRLNEDVVSGRQPLLPFEQVLRALIVAVSAINCRVEHRRIDEQGHRRRCRAATASPTFSSLCVAISDPPESPSPNMAEISPRTPLGSRSRLTSRRMYSAREMPCSAA